MPLWNRIKAELTFIVHQNIATELAMRQVAVRVATRCQISITGRMH